MKTESLKKKFTSKRLRYNPLNSSIFLYTLLLFWLVFIIVFSIIPISGKTIYQDSDKLVHFFIYLITSSLFHLCFRIKFKKPLVWSSLFSLAFGALMETMQAFVPYRDFSLKDILADAAGILVYIVATIALRKKLIK